MNEQRPIHGATDSRHSGDQLLNQADGYPAQSKTKHKAPVFNGNIPFEVFKVQFETAVLKNKWNDDDSAGALVLALQGSPATILQTISDDVRNNYTELMDALERKHGSGHMKQKYRIELKNRVQKKEESLQDFAA